MLMGERWRRQTCDRRNAPSEEVARRRCSNVINLSNAPSPAALSWQRPWCVHHSLPAGAADQRFAGWSARRTNDRRCRRATPLACGPTNGSIPARRRGTGWPEGGKGRMSFLPKVPGLVRRIPWHRPTRPPRRVRATYWRCAVPARRGPARVTDRTIGLRSRHDSSRAAITNGGERKSEVQSLLFSPFRVPCPI
jgi:hypothetical protein